MASAALMGTDGRAAADCIKTRLSLQRRLHRFCAWAELQHELDWLEAAAEEELAAVGGVRAEVGRVGGAKDLYRLQRLEV